MRKHFSPNWLHYFIATVWIANGLFCKVLNLVPRHQEIVERILGGHARLLTILIGITEIGMAVWILIGIQKRLSAVTQILAIAAMNLLEFFLAPDLLLWGRANAIFAFAFIILICYNEFHPNKKLTQQATCFHS
ncbi:DoxX-like family protein [Terrimonas pollutisoli]|uniref:DoxX-like family protein n=1 Tax=Terrimonas pollutisoli TaxID=3034147 RepID=UPI0023EA97EB|nr:DoxX-like family protein [Terrimonas sp. H1YJ31]